MYDRAPSEVTDLSARFFATWTAITAAVRFMTAYNIRNKQLYFLTCFTLAAAVLNFGSEWLVYETTSWEAMRLSLILDIGSLSVLLLAWIRRWV